MEGRKILVLATAAAALFSLSGEAFYHHAIRLASSVSLDTQGHPSIGEGKIEMVLIEDFRCLNCRAFSEKILPQVSASYIETGQARITVIPVAFIEGSKPLANAALCVSHQSPGRFLPFTLELFRMQTPGRKEILQAAAQIGGIDLGILKECLDCRHYYDELESNLNWAKKLMGRQFGTPALFVNGIPTSTASFDAVEKRIQQIEKRK